MILQTISMGMTFVIILAVLGKLDHQLESVLPILFNQFSPLGLRTFKYTLLTLVFLLLVHTLLIN